MSITLITGSAGFIGSRLTKKLIELENSVIPYDIQYSIENGKFDILSGYIPRDVDVIYHLAAHTSVEESWINPVMYMENFNMTVRLVHQCPNARFIFAQSAAAIEASSPYGFSKWMSGEYIKKFYKNYVICTFPNVYGGGKGVVDAFKDKDEVTIYGDGEQIRDFVHVDDIVEGLVKAQNWPTGEYSMGSGVGTKISDLARDKTIHFEPARKEIRESILPNTTPDWEPKIKVETYIK